MKLRAYQADAVTATWEWMRNNPGNPAIVIPTAGGKSLIMAETARQAVGKWGGRVGIVAGSKELVAQNAAKMPALWPEADCGIYSASLKRRDTMNQVLFMQTQSVWNKCHHIGFFDLLIIDEMHLVPTKGEGTLRSLIAGLKKYNPNMRVIGYTATPWRLGSGPVCSPENIFNGIAYEAKIPELIEQGYLCPLISKGALNKPDISSVHVRGGEYVESELAQAVDRTEIVNAACDEMVRLASDRKSWIVFAVNIKHAEHVVEALRARGIDAVDRRVRPPGCQL